MMKYVLFLLLASIALVGCGIFDGGEEPRISNVLIAPQDGPGDVGVYVTVDESAEGKVTIDSESGAELATANLDGNGVIVWMDSTTWAGAASASLHVGGKRVDSRDIADLH